MAAYYNRPFTLNLAHLPSGKINKVKMDTMGNKERN